MSKHEYIIDATSNRLLSSFTSTRSEQPEPLIFGDKAQLTVQIVEPNSNNAEWPWQHVDLTGQTIRVGVGNEGGKPTSGTYTLSFSGSTTTALAYNADSTAIAAALNLVDTIIAAGGVTCSDISGGTRISFATVGVQASITADTANLYPSSVATVNEFTAGSVTVAEVQHISFDTSPGAYIELTSALPSVGSTVTEVRAGVLNTTNELQRVQITGSPYAGNYTLTIAGETTNPICLSGPLDTIADEIEALASITADSVWITGTAYDYTVEFASSLADVGPITVNVDALRGPDGKSGELDLHTTGILELLKNGTEADATLEIVRWTTANTAGETVLQVPVMVRQDVLPDTVPSSTTLPGYATIDLDQITQSGATDGQVAAWNNTSGEWEATTVSGTGDVVGPAVAVDSNLAAFDTTTGKLIKDSGVAAGALLQSTDIDTLAELNAIVGDATLIDTGDARLSDARTPTAHAASHTDGTDDIQDATIAQKGLATAAHITAIEANTAASHAAMTASDSAEIDFTVTGQDITGSLIAGSIDETKLDVSVNASLDLADSALQAETNDLTAAVTWANVPDANITETSVTQHEAALAIDADVNTVSNIDFTELASDLRQFTGIGHAMALDSPTVSVSSNGATVTLSLEKSGTGDIRFLFSDGVYVFDSTPAATIALTAGSDTAPTENFVYILQSNKTLTVSTSGWPAAEFAPVATAVVQSEASAQTEGIYKLHAWTDHATGSDGQGHLAHLNYWIRSQNATWISGCALTPTAGASTLDVAVASGEILQLHDHAFPAFNTSTGDSIYIVNDPTTAYLKKTDLTGLTQDANGDTLGAASSDFYNLVIWGVVSENDADCKLFCNLPSGSYPNDNASAATNDTAGTAIYEIGAEYRGCGFLIARLTVSVSGTTYTVEKNTDLRGLFPSTGAGGGATGGSEFSDNVFRILDDTTSTKEIAFQASTITAANTRTITMCDNDLDLRDITQLGFACSDETTALTTGQKIAIDMPHSMIVRRVYASVATAGTTSAITVDVEDEGVSILNAVLSIAAAANNTETSTFAASATSYTLTKGDLLTIDVDSVDSGGTGAGLKVVLVGHIT